MLIPTLLIALFPWAKPINKEEEVTKVICKVYSKIHGKSFILVAKSDNLWKHQGAKTTKRLGHGVVIGEGGGGLFIPYFNSTPQHTLEFQKLAACLESKSNKIPKNVKSHWISMLELANRVLKEYKPLVTKMAVDAPKESTTKKNLSILLDWQNMITLPCLLPMMHFVDDHFKFAQSPTCYIVDFIFVVKILAFGSFIG